MAYSILKITCLSLLILAGAASSKNTKCPFEYMYHFGDGATDIGNSVRLIPWGNSLPAASLPYGQSYPGTPTGRWSNGRIDFDFAAADFGFPVITPYLSKNAISSNAVIFSVANSPVLEDEFFTSRGVKIPPYVVPLTGQLRWFKNYLKSVCSTPKDCADRLGKSLVLLGDIQGNDVGYALSQGKSIAEVETYVPDIIGAQINATRELIKLGANLLVIPGSSPLGCFPYILTALESNDSSAYDKLGCLKSVNNLITFKNNYLQQALNNLSREFPNVRILYGPFDEGVIEILEETSPITRLGNLQLKACCGIGGTYNFDSKRFCGSQGVPVCANPERYMFWDGIHFTQAAATRIEQVLIKPTLDVLNCTYKA